MNGMDVILTQARRIALDMPIGLERLRQRIETVETAAPGADPERAVGGLMNSHDLIMTQAAGVALLMPIGCISSELETVGNRLSTGRNR